MIVSYYLIKHMVQLVVLRKKTPLDFLMISMYFAMFIESLVEPLFEGYPLLFWSLMLMEGMASLYVKDRRRGLIDENCIH